MKSQITFWRLIFFLFGICLGFAAFSQKKAVSKEQQNEAINLSPSFAVNLMIENEKKVLKSAMQLKDYTSAAYSLNKLMVTDTANSSWADSLCSVYFISGRNESCISLAKKILAVSPVKKETWMMLAFSQKNSGFLKDALESFEKVYGLTRDVYFLYEVAVMQYSLKRFGECELSINRIMTDSTAGNSFVTITNEKNERQQVPVKAAVMNLKGVVLKEVNRNADALKCFEEALKIFPAYLLAKSNFEALQKESVPPAGNKK